MTLSSQKNTSPTIGRSHLTKMPTKRSPLLAQVSQRKNKPNLKALARAQASQVEVVGHHQRKAVSEFSCNPHHQRNKRPSHNLLTLPEMESKKISRSVSQTLRRSESRPVRRKELPNKMQENQELNTLSSSSSTMISSQLNTKDGQPAKSQLSSSCFGRKSSLVIQPPPRSASELQSTEKNRAEEWLSEKITDTQELKQP